MTVVGDDETGWPTPPGQNQQTKKGAEILVISAPSV
jgi:hypothetical protein